MQYNEQQLVTCKGSGGTFTLAFRGQTTVDIPYDATVSEFTTYLEDLTTITNTYYTALSVSFDGDEACSVSGHQITIQFLQDYGDLPLLVANDDNLELNIATTSPSVKVSVIRDGTKEDMACSDRGICDSGTGVCSCSTGYDTSNGEGESGRRGDCGYATATTTACPGETSCNGHGTCQGTPTYDCECENGYDGADCSLMTCPYGKSWFSLPSDDEEAHLTTSECSDMGTCDRTTGECSCMDGFEGSSCSVMSCPGDPACNSQGQCYTMAQMAAAATVNGVLQEYTYGATPNDPDTWDYEMIQGCFCDTGYHG